MARKSRGARLRATTRSGRRASTFDNLLSSSRASIKGMVNLLAETDRERFKRQRRGR